MRYISYVLLGQMYMIWGRTLWPLPVAPPLPVPEASTYHVVQELSGLWTGGIVPSYSEQPWQVERLIHLSEPGWLYLYDLHGAFTLYLSEALIYRGDTHHLAVPIRVPGDLKVRIKWEGAGGLMGGIYVYALKGPVAWPIDTSRLWIVRRIPHSEPTPMRHSLQPRRIPLWVWAAGLGLWGLLAAYGASFREAQWRGPWTKQVPLPFETALSSLMVVSTLLMLWPDHVVFFLLGTGIEVIYSIQQRLSLNKLWQSWVSILWITFLLAVSWPQPWWGWLAWGGRAGLLALRFPQFLYLCTGYLSLYLLIGA